MRKHFNAVMWRFRVSSPWRDLPDEFGPWRSAYDRFRVRSKQGTFQLMTEAVIAEAAARGVVDLGPVSADSATSRAHHHADGTAGAARVRWRRAGRSVRSEGGTPAGGGAWDPELMVCRPDRVCCRAGRMTGPFRALCSSARVG
ncbi:transposase [Streptomyces sp. TLI_053]|uniref:transposase n=1 Tax=Streptomyces sp. TLI_053 TaxID=1855352 RepID=UPI00336BF753